MASPREVRRILLVAESEPVRDEVSAAFATQAGRYQFYWISQSELVTARARELVPHVVLVDDTGGHVDLARSVRSLVQSAPGAAVLALLDEQAIGRARDVVLAGARGFVTKPIVTEDLISTIDQVLAQGGEDRTSSTQSAQDGGVVLFCAPKGGTGRTTVAVNTAISLHRLTGQPVAIMDADFSSPALDVVLNLRDQRSIRDLVDRMGRLDPEVVDRVLAKHASGLRVLVAPPPGDSDLQISVPQVQQIVALLRRTYPWVIIDLGLPMDEVAYALLDGTDRIVMTVLPEMVGLRNSRVMLDQLAEHGHPTRKVCLVLNRATIRGGVKRSDIEKRLHVPVAHTVPDDQPLASLSINRGVPLVMSHEHSAVARSIEQLAQSLAAQGEPVAASSHERQLKALWDTFRRRIQARIQATPTVEA